jgi:pimeloyl-ACP methyl ester carboxylesterase
MSAEKPVIIFVHGAWHQLMHYEQFLRSLRNKGYTVVSPELPSCSDNVPTNPTEADIELIRTESRKLVEDGKEVVAIAHSYGGIVMTEAVYGLGIKERTRKGLQGGIRTLIYNTAFLPSINVCLEDAANISLFDWLEYKVSPILFRSSLSS